jgi:hypothetical protein
MASSCRKSAIDADERAGCCPARFACRVRNRRRRVRRWRRCPCGCGGGAFVACCRTTTGNRRVPAAGSGSAAGRGKRSQDCSGSVIGAWRSRIRGVEGIRTAAQAGARGDEDTAKIGLDAFERGRVVGLEAQHDHRRGVRGRARPKPSAYSTRKPSMVMISRAPSKWACRLQFVDQREGFAFLHPMFSSGVELLSGRAFSGRWHRRRARGSRAGGRRRRGRRRSRTSAP